MRPVVAQPVQIVVQQLAVSRRHPIVGHYTLQRPDDVVQFALVIDAPAELVLQLIQLLLRALNPVLIAAEWERRVLDVLQILANLPEQTASPLVSAIAIITVAVVPIIIAIITAVAFLCARNANEH